MRAKYSFILVSSLSLAIVGCGGSGGSTTLPPEPYDGPTLAFFSDTVEGTMVMQPDGSERQTVHANTSHSSMSQNGRVFTSIENGANDDIFSMNADGTGAQKLTNTGADFRPVVSPDGSKVVFISTRDSNFEIYVMNGNGSNETRLTNDSHQDYFPAISADGTKVVFTSNRDNSASDEIYTINVDGTGLTRITNNAATDINPAWSPDGTKIVFSSDRDGNWELYSMDADGGNVTRLTTTTTPGAEEFHPSFMLDGSAIFYYRGNQIYRMNPDGTGQTNISNNANQETKLATWVY